MKMTNENNETNATEFDNCTFTGVEIELRCLKTALENMLVAVKKISTFNNNEDDRWR